MTKLDLVETLIDASHNKLDKDIADDCITTILNKIAGSLLKGETVKLHNIGSLQTFAGAPRLCRDVVRGEPIRVGPKTRVRFVSSSVLKKRLQKLDQQGKKNEVD